MSYATGVSEPTKIYVGGINYTTDEDKLRSQFSQYGIIEEVIIVRDRETGKSKGFGFIKFDREESAETAISSMNGMELDNRTIKVSRAQKPSRGGGGGGGGFRGGRGGYSGGGRGVYQGGYSNGVGMFGQTAAYGGAGNYGGWTSGGTGYTTAGYAGMNYGGQYGTGTYGQASSAAWPSSGTYGNYGSSYGTDNYNQGGGY